MTMPFLRLRQFWCCYFGKVEMVIVRIAKAQNAFEKTYLSDFFVFYA